MILCLLASRPIPELTYSPGLLMFPRPIYAGISYNLEPPRDADSNQLQFPDRSDRDLRVIDVWLQFCYHRSRDWSPVLLRILQH